MIDIDESTCFYDISPLISEKLGVWPGDVTFERKLGVEFKKGGNIDLSSIRTTLHLGSHADAPCHYSPSGEGIEKRDIFFYWGSCQVITVSLLRGSRILPIHLENIPLMSQRILFKTQSFPNLENWNHDFVALSGELIDFLAHQGVILVGVDTPSIDLFQDSILEAHQAIFKNNMAILEGLLLDSVPDDVYFLSALPLKIKEADASPVRAILVKKKEKKIEKEK